MALLPENQQPPMFKPGRGYALTIGALRVIAEGRGTTSRWLSRYDGCGTLNDIEFDCRVYEDRYRRRMFAVIERG